MRRVFFILTLLVSASVYAEDFRILFLNTDSIKIGKNECRVGDTFSDAEKIVWKDGKQAMKVISLETKRQYVFVSEDFKHRKMKSAKDFIVKNNRLSTRGLGNLSSVEAAIGDRIYWVDPILIAIDYEPEAGEYFFLNYSGKTVTLGIEDGQLVFDSRIWGDGECAPVEAELYFHYKDGEDELVSPSVAITPIPEEIHLKKR